MGIERADVSVEVCRTDDPVSAAVSFRRDDRTMAATACLSQFLIPMFLGGLLMLGCGREPELEPGRTNTRDVVIVGGGISGLAAAHLLKDQDVLLLEKEPVVGGRAISGAHDGVVYAKGTEYLGELEGTLAQIAKDLGSAPFEIPAPMDAKIQDGRLYVGEDQISQMIAERAGIAEFNRFVSVVQTAAAKISEGDLSDPEIRRLDGLSTLDWFKENKFQPIFLDYYNVSCRGLFGANLAESSALCMIPEIGFDYTNSVPLRRVSKNKSAAAEKTGSFTFTGGISALCEAMARNLGTRVQLACTVTDVKRVETGSGTEFFISYRDGVGQERTVTSRSVILAAPAPVALKLAGSALTEEQKTLMSSAEYAQYMTVALFSSTPIFEEAFDLAVPDGMFFTDLYPGGWAEKSANRPPGAYVLSAYVAPKNYRDNLLKMTDGEVLQRVLNDLDQLFPGASSRVTGHEIQRFPYGYPVMTTGAYARMDRLSGLDGKGLFLAGDYLTNPTFDAAAESGATAAERCETFLNSTKK